MLVLRYAVMLLAVGPLVYYLLCLYSVIDYFRQARLEEPGAPGFAPPMSILKPVRGLDHDAYENFASYCRLDYPEYELVFAVADQDDPVMAVIEKLQRDFPKAAIRVVTEIPRVGVNSKVNSLASLVHAARYEHVVMTDSDVRVEPSYLREVAAPFADASVGAVTAFYRCTGGGTLAASLDELGMCLDSAPSALVARSLEGKVQFAFGWTMATTKQCLREIGGWEAMANYHSDDFELGNRIAKRGRSVVFMREPVWMVFPRETLGEYLRHELRWSIGLRNVRPAGYAGMIFTHGLPWAVLAALVAPWWQLAAAFVIAYLALRFAVGFAAGSWGLRDRAISGKLWLFPLRDAVSFAVWVAGIFRDKILWRGIEYRVQRGLLVPVASVTKNK